MGLTYLRAHSKKVSLGYSSTNVRKINFVDLYLRYRSSKIDLNDSGHIFLFLTILMNSTKFMIRGESECAVHISVVRRGLEPRVLELDLQDVILLLKAASHAFRSIMCETLRAMSLQPRSTAMHIEIMQS